MQRTGLTGVLAGVMFLTVSAGCAVQRAQKDTEAGPTTAARVVNNPGPTARGAISGAAVGGTVGATIARQMDEQARELGMQLTGATVRRVGESIAVTFPESVLFVGDSDSLTPQAADLLGRLAASLTKFTGTRAMIASHSDTRGAPSRSVSQTELRSQAAASAMAATGVDRARMDTAGCGETEPLESNGTEAGRRQNRRVEVAIFADDASRKPGL